MIQSNGKLVLSSVVAAIAALGLALSVSYAFPASTSSTPQSNVNSINCSPSDHGVLNMTKIVNLTANGTRTINGTIYWYATFVPSWSRFNESSVLFEGVNFSVFSISHALFGLKQPKIAWTISGATVLSVGNAGNLCTFLLPSVGIHFADGKAEYYNLYVVSINYLNSTSAVGNMTFNMESPVGGPYGTPSTNPWFTTHETPRAGVGYQSDGGAITLYVSKDQ